MSLSITLLVEKPTEVYSANITHNLVEMAKEAGIYDHLWQPEKIEIGFACEIIKPIQNAISLMKSDPKRFEKYNSPNGWGTLDNFICFLEKYLEACKKNPGATIFVCK